MTTSSAALFKQRLPRVQVVSWKPGLRNLYRPNFGDDLSGAIVDAVLASRGLSLESSTGARLLAIGSILHMARDGDVLWSTGRNGKIADWRHRFSRLDVRATRGPLTRDYLAGRGISAPEVYGDAGLLLPLVRPDIRRPEPTRDYVVVPNLHDRIGPDCIDPRREWEPVVRDILAAKFVVSSSLHGLVIADAYGIPSRWIGGKEARFKFDDYYRGTGRYGIEPARHVAEALDLGPVTLADFEPNGLLDAFPFDLF